MSSKVISTVRLVRCPKCRNVLPEPLEVLVYECGGCGTKLQAKKRNNPIDNTITTSQKLKDEFSGKRKPEQVSDNDPRSSTELSGHDHDPDSSPEAIAHKKMDRKQDEEDDYFPNAAKKHGNVGFEQSAENRKMDHLSDDGDNESDLEVNDEEFLSCRKGTDFEESSSELEEAFADIEFGGTSCYGYGSPVIHENPKTEIIELLKMVRELQDQLERTNVTNVAPSYHNRILNGHGRYGWPQNRQQVCSCGPHYVANPSGQSSLKLVSESEFSAPYRSPMKKRYVRPVSGGSPWISCYGCSEILQLPQSFLVFKRKCHSLKCGACFTLLNFTVSNRTRVSRYYPEETNPSLSKVIRG